MSLDNYLKHMKEIQQLFLEYLDTDKSLSNDSIRFHIKYFQDLSTIQAKHGIEEILYLLSSIFCNHHRSTNFYEKFIQIIKYFKDIIKQTFTVEEIIYIFSSNNQLILYLIKEKVIDIDEKTVNLILQSNFNSENFFKPEIIKMKGLKIDENDQIFETKRNEGENDQFICQLIRKDSIDDFIIYVNQKNIDLNSTIKPSIFETNSFLIEDQPTLIEYAAFFGSIKIFKYLFNNEIKLTPSLWLYSIHSNNSELISFLEENKINPEEEKFNDCLIEAIKCYHNEIANYIIENHMSIDDNDINAISIKNQNYEFINNQPSLENIAYLIQNDYYIFVNFLLKENFFDINGELILNNFFFELCFMKKNFMRFFSFKFLNDVLKLNFVI